MPSLARPLARSLARSLVIGSEASAAPEPEPEEFITNGAFAADTDWTKGAGWTIAAGVASNSGTFATLSQTLVSNLTTGNDYVFSMDVVSNTESVQIRVSLGTPGGQIIYQATPGVETITVPFTSTGDNTVILIRDSFGDGLPGLSIDNVSLVPA